MSRPWLTRNLVALGLVSLLTDAASEMVVPFLPFFVTGVLLGSATFAGLIEGLAEALASTLKLVAGRLADRSGKNRPFVLVGYTLSSIARPLVALAASPVGVLVVRLADRTGKGLRSSPRDAIIAASTPREHHGRAFAFHRAMDHAGAVVGPLVALAVLSAWPDDLRRLFGLAAIPGALAVLAIIIGLREDPAPAPAPARPAFGPAGPRLRWFLAATGALTLGRPAEVLLLPALGASRIGLADVPLLWVGLHVVKVLASLLGGALADRSGRRAVVGAGWVVHVLVMVGLATVESAGAAKALFLVWGVSPGLSEGAEKAVVADLAPADARGTSFGWYHLVVGLGALPASALFGLLWERRGGPAAFAVAAAAGALGVLLLSIGWLHEGGGRPPVEVSSSP